MQMIAITVELSGGVFVGPHRKAFPEDIAIDKQEPVYYNWGWQSNCSYYGIVTPRNLSGAVMNQLFDLPAYKGANANTNDDFEVDIWYQFHAQTATTGILYFYTLCDDWDLGVGTLDPTYQTSVGNWTINHGYNLTDTWNANYIAGFDTASPPQAFYPPAGSFTVTEADKLFSVARGLYPMGGNYSDLVFADPLFYTHQTGEVLTIKFGKEPPITLQTRLNRRLWYSTGNPDQNFYQYLYIRPFNINETVRGDLEATNGYNPHVFLLVAPNNYTWNTPDPYSFKGHYKTVDASGDYTHGTKYGNYYIWINSSGGSHIRVSPDRKVLEFVIHVYGDIKPGFAETLSLYGISLVADDRALIGEDVYIDVYHGYWGTAANPIIWGPQYGMGANWFRFEGYDWVPGWQSPVVVPGIMPPAPTALWDPYLRESWRALNLNSTGWEADWATQFAYFDVGFNRTMDIYTHRYTTQLGAATRVKVGKRVENEMAFGLRPGETVRDLRSGEIWSWQWRDYPDRLNSVNTWDLNLVAEYRPYSTPVIRLDEKAPNAWGATAGIDARITIPPDGVRIIGAFITMGTTDHWNVARTWYEAQSVSTTPTAEGILVKPDYIQFIPHLQNWNDRTLLRWVDIELVLSIEAGYEHKYGPELWVYAQGPSLANLAENNREVLVANVYDPVQVSIDESAVTVSNFAYNTNSYAIGDVLIEERKAHDLKKGDNIWVYIRGNREFDVDFTSNPYAIVDDASGLQLRKGTAIRHRWGNSWVVGMSFEIETESSKAPAVITLTECAVIGTVYPDVVYDVVVSGEAVARNDFYVYEDWLGAEAARDYNWWLFDYPPYAVAALELEEDTFGDLQVEPPIEIPSYPDPGWYVPEGPTTLTLNEFTPASAETGNVKPFILRDVAPGYKLGLISLRTFGTFIGASEISWDDATKTAKIVAKDLRGNNLEISMVSGSTTGYINGVGYDIAEYSGSAPSGTCTALNEGGVLYLPLRFVMNAYGGTLSWDANTWTATLHKY